MMAPNCNQIATIQHFRDSQLTSEPQDQLSEALSYTQSTVRDLYSDSQWYSGEQWRIAAIERKNLRDAVLSYLNEHPSKKEQKAIEALQQCRDFSMLEKTLVEEKQKWFENRKLGGKPQDLFHRMCSTLEGHQSILSAFPDSNIYVSIFCAAFKTVIRASRNHQGTAENLVRDLLSINETVSAAFDRVRVFQTPAILANFAELYAKIFVFYATAIQWYKANPWKKAIKSLNSNYYESHFSSLLSHIGRLGESIIHKAEAGNQARLRDVQKEVHELRRERQLFEEVFGQDRTAQSEMLHKLMLNLEAKQREEAAASLSIEPSRNQVNENLVALLKSSIEVGPEESLTITISRDSSEARRHLRVGSIQQDTLTPSETPQEHNYEGCDMVTEVECLQKYISGQDLNAAMIGDSKSASISKTTFHRIQTWARADASTILWVRGPDSMVYPSEVSSVAANIITILWKTQPQLLFHFSELPPIGADLQSTREEAGFVSLLYSLISQLVYSLPPNFQSPADFSHDRFAKLGDSVSSWDEALRLLGDLVSVSLPYAICVIDGLERLDYAKAQPRCAELLGTIRKIMKYSSENGRVFKVLFTSAGNSGTLMRGLDTKEICMDCASPQQWRREREGLGGTRISQLN